MKRHVSIALVAVLSTAAAVGGSALAQPKGLDATKITVARHVPNSPRTHTAPPPKSVGARLTNAELLQLRPALAKQLGVAENRLPSQLAFAGEVGAVGSTVNVGVGGAPSNGAVVTSFASDSSESGGKGTVTLQGSSSAPHGLIGVFLESPPAGTYLTTCYVSTNMRDIKWEIRDQGGGTIGRTSPQDGKLLVPYVTSANPGRIEIWFAFDSSNGPGETLTLSSCDFTRLQ